MTTRLPIPTDPIRLGPNRPPSNLIGAVGWVGNNTTPPTGGPTPPTPVVNPTTVTPTPLPAPDWGGKGGSKVPLMPDPINDPPTPLPTPDWGGKNGGKLPPAPTVPTNPTTPPVTPTNPTDPTAPPVTPPPTGVPLNGGFGLDFMRQVTPNELVANQLDGLLKSNSPYMKNAALRGAEFAASRGNLNSSIGAGASQRAALEAALPIAESDAGVYRQANQGNFEALSDLRKVRVTGEIQNWLDSEAYTRDFNGKLAMLPITSGADMLAYITQRALEDPAVYSPDVISGFNNFFNLNFNDMMSRLLNPSGGN